MGTSYAAATAHTSADPATVYALLCDGTTWPTWIFVDSFELEKEGPEGGESVGAIRVFRFKKFGRSGASREQVRELVQDRKFAYGLLEGMPILEHRADVDLTPAPDGGTDIRWSATWRPRYVGTGLLLRLAIGKVYRDFTAGLAKKAAEIKTA